MQTNKSTKAYVLHTKKKQPYPNQNKAMQSKVLDYRLVKNEYIKKIEQLCQLMSIYFPTPLIIFICSPGFLQFFI